MKKDILQNGDRIEVYRNLHKDCFSVRKNGRVVKHVQDDEQLYMSDVKFVVQPAGRRKVIRERRKNVHAFVRGTYDNNSRATMQMVVHYNPYSRDHFFTVFGGNVRPIYEARVATLHKGKVYATP